MNTLAQAIVSGLGQGSIYALLALGFVMVFKATGVISFAQPALMVCGGLIAYHFSEVLGMNFWASLLIAMILGAALGAAIERSVLRPMLGKPVFVLAIVTIGIDVVLRVLANRYMGSQARPIDFPGGSKTIEIAGVNITHQRLALIAVTAVTVIAVVLFFRYAKAGLAMRATALDQETALAQGIRVSAVFALAWAMAGALAAIAGTFIASGGVGIEQSTWQIALKALPAIIIGGLDSVPGAVVGGLAVGLVETFTAVYQPDAAPWLGQNFSLVAPYALMLVVLLVRPYGIFGTREVERV